MGILRTNTVSGLETPTPVTGSVVFDGSGDYLKLASSGDFGFSTGDFTVEYWIYNTQSSYTDNSILDLRVNSGSNNPLVIRYVGTSIKTYWAGADKHNISNGLTQNRWTHHSIVRNGSNVYFFIDGINQQTVVSSASLDSLGECSVGAYRNGTDAIAGYISNLRILKGTALYTSNFTPPTRELQPIGDTVLLCCNNSTSATAEATGKSITVNGNAAASTFSPALVRDFTYGTQFDGVSKFDTQGYFVPPSANTQNRYTLGLDEIVTDGLVLHLDAGNPFSYPVTGVGTHWNDLSGNNNRGVLYNGVSYTENNRGSLVFDGTNDYVVSDLNLNLLPQVSFSAWVYTSRSANNCGIMGNDNNSFGRVIRCFNGTKFQILNSNGIAGVSLSDIPLNQWFNIVVTWSTSAVKFYLNSTQEQTTFAGEAAVYDDTTSTYFGSTGPSGGVQYLLGNISNIQIYNKVLTAAEIQQNYEALKGRYGYS